MDLESHTCDISGHVGRCHACKEDGYTFALLLLDTFAAGLEHRDAHGATFVREAYRALDEAPR